MVKNFRLLAIFTLVLMSFSAMSEVYDFSRSGIFTSSKYTEKESFREFKNGDVLEFENGKSFHILEELGQGGTTRIFKVYDIDDAKKTPRALRIPMFYADKSYIDSTIEGYPALKRYGVTVPKIYSYFSNHYVEVEYIEYDFNGYDFFMYYNDYSDELLMEAERALSEFARTTLAFSEIGDFKPEQMVYSHKQRKWILLDWTKTHEFSVDDTSLSVFDSHGFMSHLEPSSPRMWVEDTPEYFERVLRIILKVTSDIRKVREDLQKDEKNIFYNINTRILSVKDKRELLHLFDEKFYLKKFYKNLILRNLDVFSLHKVKTRELIRLINKVPLSEKERNVLLKYLVNEAKNVDEYIAIFKSDILYGDRVKRDVFNWYIEKLQSVMASESDMEKVLSLRFLYEKDRVNIEANYHPSLFQRSCYSLLQFFNVN